MDGVITGFAWVALVALTLGAIAGFLLLVRAIFRYWRLGDRARALGLSLLLGIVVLGLIIFQPPP